MNKINFLVGDKVILRGLTADDASEDYQQWLNDIEVTTHMETGKLPVSHEDLVCFIESANASDKNLLLGIYLKESGGHVGNLKLGPINWLHRNAELGIMIGSSQARGVGAGAESIRLLLDHAFNRLNLIRVSLGVVETNIAAVKCYEKVGFRQEGVHRNAVLSCGEKLNVIRMGILAEEYLGK